MADTPNPSGAPDMGDAFRRNVGSAHEEPDLSVNGTARAAIKNAQAHEDALGAHDEKWRMEMNKLASASDPYPDFDLGSRAHRNLLGEYEERRTDWERERDQIDNSFSVQKDHIRKTGQTLSDEFTFHHGRGPEPDGNAPTPQTPNSPPTGGHAEDFKISDGQTRGRNPSEEFAVQAQSHELERVR